MNDRSHGAIKSRWQDKCPLLSQNHTQGGEHHSRNEVKQNRSTQVTEIESHSPFRDMFLYQTNNYYASYQWSKMCWEQEINRHIQITYYKLKKSTKTQQIWPVCQGWTNAYITMGKLSSQMMWDKCSEPRAPNSWSILAKVLHLHVYLLIHSLAPLMSVWIYTCAHCPGA